VLLTSFSIRTHRNPLSWHSRSALRIGATHQPHYRIVVAETRSRRDGDAVETLDVRSPHQGQQVNLRLDRVDYWISKGAKPTDTLHSIIKRARRGASTAAEARRPSRRPNRQPPAEAVCQGRWGTMPRIDVLTLFPRMLDGFLARASWERGLRRTCFPSPCTTCADGRTDKHRTADDRPFGGGAGMVMSPSRCSRPSSSSRRPAAGGSTYPDGVR